VLNLHYPIADTVGHGNRDFGTKIYADAQAAAYASSTPISFSV